jgi:hypothetical protein
MATTSPQFTDEVTISDFGGGNPRRLPVVGASVSWELSNVGNFSAFARIEDLQRYGLGGELKGMWLEWRHRTAGRFGGVIVGRPFTDGVAELSVEGWATLLRHRPLIYWDRQAPASAAGIARHGVMAAETNDPSFITLGTFDESGEAIGFRLGGQDTLNDMLPQLVDDGAMEWSVDADRVLSCGQALGVDRSASVRLTENVEILTAKFADDAYTAPAIQQFEVQLPAGASRDPTRRPGSSARPSVNRRWVDPRVRRIAAAATTESQFVTLLRTQTTPVELTICDRNSAYYHTQLGDTVRIVVETAGFSGTFRIHARGLDSSQDVMTLAGEATPDGWLP